VLEFFGGGMKMATLTKCRNGAVPLIALVFFFSMANLAFAETKVFVEEYTYQASEYDSKVSCRALAIEQVKRLLLEKLGTYLESETEVKNFRLTKDQIVILTAGIVRAEIIDERWDGKTYYLKAMITADPKDVANSIDKLRQDRQKTKELEETRKKADEALKEVERLKRELETAKAGKTEQEQYKAAVNRLSATDWFNKGLASGTSAKHQEAMEAFSKAVELDSKYAWAYMNRGIAYGKLGDYRQAIRDYDRVIQLDTKYAAAYSNRGVAYGKLGDYRQAIRDFERAIQLNPNDAIAYNNRGIAYGNLGDHRQAIANYRAAARLGVKSAQDFLRSRGIDW
jgi:tetratricopeptide (TPR) repeat protein